MGAHRMYNKQKVLFVALENMKRTRKFLPPSGLPEFCIVSLYFVYSAPFLYVPLSLQKESLFHSKSLFRIKSKSCLLSQYHLFYFFLSDYSLSLISSHSSPLRRGNPFLHPFLFLSYLILGVPPWLVICALPSHSVRINLALSKGMDKGRGPLCMPS